MEGVAGYRRDIDGLRAIAILSVVLFHGAVPGVAGGYVGVDVFFVISGYLIGGIIYRDAVAGVFSMRDFYARRAKRILPPLFATLLGCSAMAWMLLSPGEIKSLSQQALATLFSVSNVFFFLLRGGYFAADAELKPLLMTWSLAIEEQFYVVFPLLILLLLRYARRALMPVLLLVTLLSFASSCYALRAVPLASFYLLPTRAWELAAGAMLAIHESRRGALFAARPGYPAWLSHCSGMLGLGLVLWCSVSYSKSTPFPGEAALLPVLGCLLLIASHDGWVNRQLLSSRLLVGLGLISYSFYLWHWPLLSVGRIVTVDHLNEVATLGLLMLALLLSVLSYFWIERPFRRSRTPATTLLWRYAATGLVLASPPLLGIVGQGGAARYPELAQMERSAADAIRNPCLVSYGGRDLLAASQCRYADVVDGRLSIALLGDSHASALEPALGALAQAAGLGLVSLIKASCPPLGRNITKFQSNRPAHADDCRLYNAAALQRVIDRTAITTVIVAGYWSAPIGADSAQFYFDARLPPPTLSDEHNWRQLEVGLSELVDELQRAGKQVWIATDAPRFETDPLLVLRSGLIERRAELASWLGWPVSVAKAELGAGSAHLPAIDDSRADAIVRRVAEAHGAGLIDLHAPLCADGGRCSFIRDGRLLYSDRQHLTADGAERALAPLADALSAR